MVKCTKILLVSLILYFGYGYSAANASVVPVKSILEQTNSFFDIPSTNPGNADDSDSKFVIYIDGSVLNIKYNKPSELANGEVVVFNLLGQILTRKKLENITVNQVPIAVQNTCYIVKITYSGKVHTQKVVPSGN
ncbi:MAG TPA: T9SS type A sorting domain-containing protein [Bacteroidales bacterium]